MSAMIRTPNLRRALADYTEVLGFTCFHYIPGVFALVAQGPLLVHLWACGAKPGRWEKEDPRDTGFAPEHHSVPVTNIHALHASLHRATRLAQQAATAAEADTLVQKRRMNATGPRLQAWGAWEFEFQDIDGHVLHCVDWSLYTELPTAPSINVYRPGLKR